MTIEEARRIWTGKAMSSQLKTNKVLHHTDERLITLAGNFTADQLEAISVLMRAGEL